MLFTASGLVFLLFVTISVVIILDVRAKIRYRATQMNRASVSWNEALALGNGFIAPDEIETLDANAFSTCLLSAIEGHAEAGRGCAPAEETVSLPARGSRD